MLNRGKWRPAILAATASMTTAAVAMPPFGGWSGPVAIETLAGSSSNINTAATDGCMSLSRDGLTMAFSSNRLGAAFSHDIYIAKRASTLEGFGDPVRLDAPISTNFLDFCPSLRGNRLYFTSTRTGAGDIYVTRLGPKGWTPPENLGPNINSPTVIDETPSFYEDSEGREVMVFSRRPSGPVAGPGGRIYQSIDGGPATFVAGGPNGPSSAGDNRPGVTHDGLTIFWDSLRTGSLGSSDIWYATRTTTSEPFGIAIHLPQLSSSAFEGRAFISWDGTALHFASERPGEGAPDIWFATREKATGN